MSELSPENDQASLASQPHQPARMLFSVEEAAMMLSIHRSTVYDLVANGSLASLKIGRRRLISRHAMEQFIVANEVEDGDGH